MAKKLDLLGKFDSDTMLESLDAVLSAYNRSKSVHAEDAVAVCQAAGLSLGMDEVSLMAQKLEKDGYLTWVPRKSEKHV